ncbi:MAG: hypothetical protein ACK4GN_14430 [Runella sp.]
MKRSILITLLFLGIYVNSSGQKAFKIDYSPFYKSINKTEFEKIKLTSKYQVVVLFDAKCSFCIVSFIDAFKKIDSIGWQKSVCYLFVAKAENLFLTRHYLRKAGIVLQKNQLLLHDEKGDFMAKNKFIDESSLNMIIADKKNSVLKIGPPDKLLEFYSSL